MYLNDFFFFFMNEILNTIANITKIDESNTIKAIANERFEIVFFSFFFTELIEEYKIVYNLRIVLDIKRLPKFL